jgi:formylglycine-generating enzyme required for sulfatase activity
LAAGRLRRPILFYTPADVSPGTWSGDVSPTGDDQCISGAATTGEPGALLRGGSFNFGTSDGPLAVDGSEEPSDSLDCIGFRCAR